MSGIQNVTDRSVGTAKEGNWPPAPNALFNPVLRVYGPGEAEQSGQWKALAVDRIK